MNAPRLYSAWLLAAALLLTAACPALAQHVGIGTSAPTQALDVNGQLRVRGLSGTGTRLPTVGPDGTLGLNPPVYNTPAVIPVFPTAAVGSVATDRYPSCVAVSGATACVMSSDLGTLQVFDVSNPASPALLGSVGTGSALSDLAMSGTTAYVVNSHAGTLQIYDVSRPASPVLLGSVAAGVLPHRVAVSGTTAYVTNIINGALQVFDVSNPANPTRLGSVATAGTPYDVAVSGTTAYLVNGNSLQLYDVSNPASPTRLGSVATGSQPRAVVVSGSTAYAVGDANTLQVFDVSNPASPALLGNVGTGSQPGDVVVSGPTAYVVNYGSNSLQVFDVSNPANPMLLGSVATGSGPSDLALNGTTAYVVNNDASTLQVFSIPGSPRVVTVQADGSLASVRLPGPADYIQNTTSPQAASNFNISGTGRVAGTLTVGGTLTAATVRVGNLTAPGFVTTDANGNLSSGGTSAGNFVLNTTTPQASSNFNVSGNGTVGGTLTAANAMVTTALTGNGASLAGGTVGVGVQADGGLNLAQHGVGNNLLLGYLAGQALTPNVGSSQGIHNQFVGYQAGQATSTGSFNTFTGSQSGYSTSTGGGNAISGYQSGYQNATGNNNTFYGYQSGYSSTGGTNTFSGYQSGYFTTTGSRNTFSGPYSGFGNTTGSDNTALGYNSGPAIGRGAISNATAVGANVALTQSNTLVLGNGASVGIDVATPTAKLDVNGSARVRGLGGAGVVVADAGGNLGASAGGSVLTSLASAQKGTATLGPGAAGLAVFTVTFPAAFAAVPAQILCTVRTQTGQSYTDTFAVTTKNISANGFQVNVQRVDANGLWGQNLLLDWLALP